jgi:hypothetical protein
MTCIASVGVKSEIQVRTFRSATPLDHAAVSSEHTGCDAFFVFSLICFTKQA